MLKIDTMYKKGILFIRLYGVINKNNIKEINEVLERTIEKVGIKYLLLNFENVYYISSNISSLIEKWSKRLIERNGKFFVCKYDEIAKSNFLKINTDEVLEMQDEVSVFNKVNI
jgi:anti-anti-sigma factor